LSTAKKMRLKKKGISRLKIRSFFRGIFSNWIVKSISLLVAILLFVFNRISNLEENPMRIPLLLQVPEDFAVASGNYRKYASVVIKGDPDLDIQQITEEDIEVYVDLMKVDKEGVYREPIRYRKIGPALNISPLEIDIEPSVLKIKLEKKMQRSVEIDIKDSIKGKPAKGYKLVSYTFAPSIVQITGPSSKIKEVNNVTIEDIDLTGRTRNFTASVKLVSIDPLVRFKGGSVIEFSAVIEEIIEEKTFEEKKITSKNVSPNLQISKVLSSGKIKIRGAQNALEKLKQSDIELYIDCSNIHNQGKYSKQIKALVPENMEVIFIEPETLIVDFRIRRR